MKTALLIFLGGGIGSLLRFFISKYGNGEWSYGTFTANIIGCFVIGLLMALYQKESLSSSFVFLLAVGFCGGLTTFSTFAFELMEMIQTERWKPFILYSTLSVMVGVLMALLGYKLAQ